MALDLSSLMASRISMTWTSVLSLSNMIAEVCTLCVCLPFAWKSQALAKTDNFCQ